jgi:hypothetical protein
VANCPSCGSTIVQGLGPGYVSQVPPQRFDSSVGQVVRRSRYPGLYTQPRRTPGLDLRNLFRATVSPRSAMPELYLSTDLRHAMFLVGIATTIYATVSTAVTGLMPGSVGLGDATSLDLLILGALGWIIAVVSFLVFALVSSIVSHEVFGGRGDKGSTIALTGYCYPWFVLVTVALLTVFAVGFGDLDLSQVQDWGDAEVERAIAWGALLLVSAIAGLIWLLAMTGRAISVANDISGGEGALSAIIGSIAAGLVSLAVGAVLRLPLGLTL